MANNPLNVRCFVEIQKLITSNPGLTSSIGELSTLSLTYSTSIAEHFSTKLNGYKLSVFNATDTTTNSPASISQNLADIIIQVVDEAVLFSKANQAPLSSTKFIDTLTANLTDVVNTIKIGPFTTFSLNGNFTTLPNWISFNTTDDGSAIKVWLNDTTFQNQYDLSSIVVVPPLSPIDNFFKAASVVENLLKQVSTTDYVNAIQSARNNLAETSLRAYTFNCIPQPASTPPLPTTWSVLIYGSAGDNLDSAKDAIQTYIAAHTSTPLATWQAVFPEIYQKTEFTILPRWDLVSIPFAKTVNGLYSAITSPQENINFSINQIKHYTAEHTTSHIAILPHYYRYIALLLIPGETNPARYDDIKKLFPDYLSQSAIHLDFNRMSPKTQAWNTLLENMLIAAEDMTDVSELPANMKRVYRNNKMYLQAAFDNINYVMAAKSNYA